MMMMMLGECLMKVLLMEERRKKERSTEKALWEARVVVVIRTRWMTMIYCDNKWPPCEGYCPNRND